MIKTIDYRKLLLPPAATIRQAIAAMTAAGTDIVMIVAKAQRLQGIVVDSDIRKAILKGIPLDAKASRIMNTKPMVLPHDMDNEALTGFFHTSCHSNIPLVDSRGRIRGLARKSLYLDSPTELPNWVVLMVGGQGRRLHPLTEHQPKPLLHVGNKPILETIIEQFVPMGLRRFFLAINHHAAKIRSHFGNGRSFGAEIRYVEENRPLGTAGPLSLIGKDFSAPLIVMNGDLLTKVDFKALLRFHGNEGSLATLCVREYDFQVPYGVVRIEDSRMLEIVEKPTHRFFVNAGIYVLEPKALSLVPKNRRFDMPCLLKKIGRRRHGSVGCFPIREYWIDIGQFRDYERAQTEYGKFFL